MPIVILHIPDYLICLPIWFYQREKILKKKNGIELMKAFENCLLFKHEMLYLQLPGLHEIIVFMASHREVGIKDAVKSINHLYWFTFQQKQAKRAMATLVNDKEKTHQYIHLLMEVESYLLIKTLAEFNQVAEFYALLFEEVLQSKMKDDYTLSERVEVICREMEKEEGYRFNSKMVHTLQFSKKLLASRSLKDFYSALEILNPHQFPLDIGYFKVFEQISAQLKKIKAGLLKIESLERFETKRHFLNQQKDSLEALTQLANYDLYEPFRTLWQQTLVHCIILVEQEIKLFQGSAELSVDLKNREILISTEERMLYFTIRNKGRELATNVSVTLQTGIPVIDFRSHTGAVINAIEAGTVKELAFPISAPSPGKTTIRGTITFSDLTQEGKTLDFSFPITLLKRSVQFMEIPNPYIVGQPLKGNTPLYFGREDAYAFIDKNITTSDNHHTLVCYGLRRTGKSSLLYRIVNQGLTDPRLTPIMIDLAGIEDEKDFYATISRKVREKLSIPGSVTSVESFSNFKAFLDEIKPAMGEKCIVLMMDEFEALQTLVEKGRISELIFNNIRHLMQHEEKIIFLFCGTHRLEEMSADYWSIFFNTAMYLRISRLKPDDAIRLIKEPVKDGLVYDDLAVEQILKMTGGQPYLIQLICRTLINELNDNKKRNDAVIDDVDDVIEEIITGGTDHFSQQIWDMSTTLERLILSAAAGEMTHKQLDVIGLETLLGQVETVTAQFTRKHMLEMLEKLVSREILAEKEMRYYFPVNLLRKWLAVRHPLRKVREEI
ncbi:MAG: ATP-binding protein [Candidatus Omnitrophota bacterium]